MSTLLVCEDHRLVRQALVDQLGSLPGVTEVAEASTAEEVLTRYATLRPDCVLMDVRLPGIDGVTATRQLLRAHLGAKVIVLTGEACDRDRVRALQAGACGYLSKDIDVASLRQAVEVVLAGGQLLSPSERRALVKQEAPSQLSARELEVLEGMAAGRSNAQIARELWVSQDTVKGHAKKVFAKIGVHDRAGAVAWALRSGALV